MLNLLVAGLIYFTQPVPVNYQQVQQEEQINYEYYQGQFSPEWNLDVMDWVAKC